MAKISFGTLQETINNNRGGEDGIRLFTLKQDKDEAIVRIMHDTIDDLEIIVTHTKKVGDKYRQINCIRTPLDPISQCPLCLAGEKIKGRIFIRMIQYTRDANGQIIATPVVWERAAGEYANKLKTLMEEYGPLSDCIFKIRRNGKEGDMKTTYEILYGPPHTYSDAMYPKIPNAFDNYHTLGRFVLDKTAEEINEFLATGNFPNKNTDSNSEPPAQQYPATPQYGATPHYNPQPQYTATPPSVGEPSAPPSAPYGNPTTARPTRYY